MTPIVEIHPAGEWATAVATELGARLRAEPTLRLCLPTGDTPAPVYAAVVAAARRGEIPFAEATVVLLDEYVGLAADDPVRCDARIRRELLDQLAAPPAYHPIDDQAADSDAAAAAHDVVAAAGLDLTLLGLGRNGHVGMNEPGSGPESATRVTALHPATRQVADEQYGADHVPTHGITLGMDRLLASREIWLLVAGAAKAEILARALEGPESVDCPASFLRRHPRYRVIADEPAATHLVRRPPRA